MPQAVEKLEVAPPSLSFGRDLSKVRVLVLDDNEFDQKQIVRTLKSAGINSEVSCADNLEDFSKFAETGVFDFALIDFNLPDGSGLDALAILQDQPEDKQALPIMIAGEGRMEVAVQAMKDGCRDFIPKQDLSAGRLRSSLLGAMRSTMPLGNIDIETQLQEQVQVMMGVINDVAIAGLRPRLSRMLRGLRQAASTQNDDMRVALLRSLDETCMELHEYCERFSHEVARKASKPH